MNEILIRWGKNSASYYASIGLQMFYLKDGKIFFYDKDGNVEAVTLEGCVQFDIKVDCDCEVRKKVDYTRGEVFLIRRRCDKYELYIPKKEVNFKEGKETKVAICKGLYESTIKEITFDADNFSLYYPTMINHTFFKGEDDTRVKYKTCDKVETTELCESVQKLCTDIKRNCGANIDYFDMVKILEKYDINKKCSQ